MNSNMKNHWTRIPLLLTAALLASCLLTAWMAVHGFYINTYLAALLTLGIVWAVCRYMQRTSRLMEQFVQSVRYSEFPEAFGSNYANGHRGLPPELLDSMQEATVPTCNARKAVCSISRHWPTTSTPPYWSIRHKAASSGRTRPPRACWPPPWTNSRKTPGS